MIRIIMTPPPTEKLENTTREEIDIKFEAVGWAI